MKHKEIKFLSSTQIFEFLYLCNLMHGMNVDITLNLFDLTELRFLNIKYFVAKI